MATNNLQKLSIGPAISVNAGTDVTATAVNDFTTEQRFRSTTQYSFISVEALDGDVMVSIARTSVGAATAAVYHQRAYEGVPRYFQLPSNVAPDVKIKATTGTVTGNVFFHA